MARLNQGCWMAISIVIGRAQLGLAKGGRCTCSAPAGDGSEVRKDGENRNLMTSNEWRMFPECFVLCSTAASSLYTWEPERGALATIPLEWHYLMVGWALSAESGSRMGGALLGPDPGATQFQPHTRHPGLPKQTLLEREERGGGHDRDNEVRKQTKDTEGFYLNDNASNRYTHICSVSQSVT